MYFKRKIDKYLKDWKDEPEHKPLIILGPRFIGKTESIRHFINVNYTNVIEINFLKEPQYKNIINDGFNPNSIIKNILLINPKFIFTDDTIIFFDNVEECPDITTSLKFFSIDGRFDIICSGQFIDSTKVSSVSVGYKVNYQMSSMDFEEFLWANGYTEDDVNNLLSHMLDLKAFAKNELANFNKLLTDYCILGGFPERILSYLKKEHIDIQNDILAEYKNNIKKYFKGAERNNIIRVLDNIVTELNKKNKKFQISKISKSARSSDYELALFWLKELGYIKESYRLITPEMPLMVNLDRDKFKVYFFDTSLFVSQLSEEDLYNLSKNKYMDIKHGGFIEQMISMLLEKQSFGLFHFKKPNSTLEMDFFVRDNDGVIPIEVKVTNGNSKALKTFVNSNEFEDIKYGIKFADSNISYDGKIYTFPYFCSFLLSRYLLEK